MVCCASKSFFNLMLDNEKAEILADVEALGVCCLAVNSFWLFATTCVISVSVVIISVSIEVFAVEVLTSFVFSDCFGITILVSFAVSTIE
jgi:hypothetical protein